MIWATLFISLPVFIVPAPVTANSKEISLSLNSSKFDSKNLILDLLLFRSASLLILSSLDPIFGSPCLFRAECSSSELNLEMKSSNVIFA